VAITLQPADRTAAAMWRWRKAALAGSLLLIIFRGATALASTQASPVAEANQVHAAIANGDVESLRYWLQVRHADASLASATEPDVTPLERCLGLATRVLDAPPASEPGSRGVAPQTVALGGLQQMVMLLHERGARLTDAARQRFSGAVLRWYDGAVSPAVAPPPAQPAAAPTAPASPDKPALRIGLGGVAVTTDARASCNGSGHPVYIVNDTQLSVTATVTTYEDGTQTASADRKTDTYTVDHDSSWRLGCDTAGTGRHVRYELIRWR
jgi:hypothetical protein